MRLGLENRTLGVPRGFSQLSLGPSLDLKVVSSGTMLSSRLGVELSLKKERNKRLSLSSKSSGQSKSGELRFKE